MMQKNELQYMAPYSSPKAVCGTILVSRENEAAGLVVGLVRGWKERGCNQKYERESIIALY